MRLLKINKILIFIAIAFIVFACENSSEKTAGNESYVSTESGFQLSANGNSTTLYVSENDHIGVLKVAKMFQEDVERVTNVKPELIVDDLPTSGNVVIIGTIGTSDIIDQLIADKKIDVSSIEGKWETFLIETVKNPIEGVDEALIIVGSDKRGTIFGMFDVSKEIGVSPLYFWADVPVKKKENVYIVRGSHTKGTPKVKYRGIFINDEAPALSGWANENFGGFNAQFYDHVFELILRMKGNYLWPSMWGRMFYVNDPQNPILANEYGIVMGTSHHEPLTRAHAEWRPFGEGDWNYNTNAEELRKFWREGMERRGDAETLVTIGMRGDGDEAMSEGTATELLEAIVKDQREIIADVTGKPAEETPQMWALYKEVQDYYDKGMQVPDDVILLLCDDNWGNLRKLPALDAAPREGGYGIYYHFDYVGGPRNHKWINTTQIEHVWEQMHLAYEHNVDQVWVVNVGDIKPMEFPIEFFLDYAWDPEAWNADNLQDYYVQWTENQFGSQYAEEIAELLKGYTKFNSRRKPELLNIPVYSLTDFNEAENMVAEYSKLAKKAIELKAKLPKEYLDAYYQLVEHPITASANLNELYLAAEKNRLYASQGRASTNIYAQIVEDLYLKDSMITKYYHEELADGKWNHIMAQTHIGYTYWQQPRFNNIPKTIELELNDSAEMGIIVEGSNISFPNDSLLTVSLPDFDNYNNQSYYIDVIDKGLVSYKFSINSENDWIKIDNKNEVITSGVMSYVSIDWSKAEEGINKGKVTILGPNNQEFSVDVLANKLDDSVKGFVESNGYISIEANNFSTKTEPQSFQWKVVENLGKTGSSVISLPIKEGRVELNENSPKLSYNVHFLNAGKVKVKAYFSPTINYTTREGMYYGLSFDDEEPTQVNYDADPWIFNYNGKVPRSWGTNVSDYIKIITTEFDINEAGNHTLNYYRVDEGLVLQKIVIETTEDGVPRNYLGPPESVYVE